ncbi:hypothetical protein BG004_002581 [Podila humilis]|nr:hypothetical protein BG004_002581 [Podila humilis]
MKSISIALLGLFASVAYATIVCKSTPGDCLGNEAKLDPGLCANAGFKYPDIFICLKENGSNDGLRVHGRDWRRHSIQNQDCEGPQRLRNFCGRAG